MHTAPRRNPWLVFGASLSCLVGGPTLGSVLAEMLAPGSEWVRLLSPLAFVAGTIGWLIGRREDRQRDPGPQRELVPPGYGAMLRALAHHGHLPFPEPE